MFDSQRILAIIPARGGSKGIKDKNIKELCGHPLIAYSILAAKQSKYIDDIVVSTDSEKIADSARAYGAWIPFLRPAHLAQDNSKTIDAIVYTITALKESFSKEYDVLILLQPTHPLRTFEDIDNAIELFFSKNCQSMASICEVSDHPFFIREITSDHTLTKLMKLNSTVRRQDLPAYYVVNGAIYINLVAEITPDTSFNDNKIGFVMKKENSVDIDDLTDFYYAEIILTKRK